MRQINVEIVPDVPAGGVPPKTATWTSGGDTVTVTVFKKRDETDAEWEAAFQEAVAAAKEAWPENT